MRIIVGYPPLNQSKGTPLLAQNRQFQYFKRPTYVYPYLLACAATALNTPDNDVMWIDCIRHNISVDEFISHTFLDNVDMIIWEVKEPVLYEVLGIQDKIHKRFPGIVIKLVGLHGGNYDLNLSGKLCLIPDRNLVPWREYAYHNGNFRTPPGTYTMFSRTCWWGKCTFCAWGENFFGKDPIGLTPEQAYNDVKWCVADGAKEIFDDSGTFPKDEWCTEFCRQMIHSNIQVRMGCNMRFSPLGIYPFNLMKRSGFRFLLWGLESANQDSLDKLHKGVDIRLAKENLELTASLGFENHITVMVGLPWENEAHIANTCKFIRDNSANIHSLQVTIAMPYDNTELAHSERHTHQLDMSQGVMSCGHNEFKARRAIYRSILTPQFVVNRLLRTGLSDAVRSFRYYLSHLFEYTGR